LLIAGGHETCRNNLIELVVRTLRHAKNVNVDRGNWLDV
jgi:hypothetical protein